MEKPWKTRWKIVESLPGGGQCHNHVVTDKFNVLEGWFVLKILKDNDTPERRERFYREVHLTNSITHSGIPDIVENNCNDLGSQVPLFFVYRYIDGTTLEKYSSDHSITLHEAIEFVKHFVNIINYCHKQGIIHRDIKPDNILLRNDNLNEPVLIDFGLGAEQEETSNVNSQNQQLGNRFLRLPELTTREGNRRDFRSDITLTVGLFYFLLTKTYPAMLLDDKGRAPHQSSIFEKCISGYEESVRIKLLEIFDMGFQNIVNDRIQSFDHLTELLNRVEVNENDKPDKYLDIVIASTSESQRNASGSLESCLHNFSKLFNQIHSRLNKLSDHIKITKQYPIVLPDQMRIFSSTIIYQKFETSISKWFQFNLYFNGHEFLLKINAFGGNTRSTDKDYLTLRRFHTPRELDDESLAEDAYQFMMSHFGQTLKIEKRNNSS